MVYAAFGPTDQVANTWYNDVGTALNLIIRNTAVQSLSAPGAAPTYSLQNNATVIMTGVAANITSMTTNLTSGTPTGAWKAWITIVGTATRTVAWGSAFEAGPSALPTTTSGTQRLDVGFIWNPTSSKWRCVASGSA